MKNYEWIINFKFIMFSQKKKIVNDITIEVKKQP